MHFHVQGDNIRGSKKPDNIRQGRKGPHHKRNPEEWWGPTCHRFFLFLRSVVHGRCKPQSISNQWREKVH
jgi:hypothetical protein